MKKYIYPIFFILIVSGCRNHVFRTYYGNIDTDTMEVQMMDREAPCYRVSIEGIDTILYCPQTNRYFVVWPTNDEHGNAVLGYDPVTKEYSVHW